MVPELVRPVAPEITPALEISMLLVCRENVPNPEPKVTALAFVAPMLIAPVVPVAVPVSMVRYLSWM